MTVIFTLPSRPRWGASEGNLSPAERSSGRRAKRGVDGLALEEEEEEEEAAAPWEPAPSEDS